MTPTQQQQQMCRHLGGSDSTSAQPTLVRRSRMAGRISSCRVPVQGYGPARHVNHARLVAPRCCWLIGEGSSSEYTLSTRMAVRPLPLYPHALMGLATYLFHQQ
jgi:hypothetical protein